MPEALSRVSSPSSEPSSSPLRAIGLLVAIAATVQAPLVYLSTSNLSEVIAPALIAVAQHAFERFALVQATDRRRPSDDEIEGSPDTGAQPRLPRAVFALAALLLFAQQLLAFFALLADHRPVLFEQRALPLLARGAALRFLLTRLVDVLNVPQGALVRPKDPLEYLRKLRFQQSVASLRDYGVEASGLVA